MMSRYQSHDARKTQMQFDFSNRNMKKQRSESRTRPEKSKELGGDFNFIPTFEGA